jgi:hypothetical protein
LIKEKPFLMDLPIETFKRLLIYKKYIVQINGESIGNPINLKDAGIDLT